MRRLMLAFVALHLMTDPSLAGSWRYCYAGSSSEHRFYATEPFEERASMERTEQDFRATLEQRHVAQDSIGCPLGTDRSDIEAQIERATEYNLRNGNAVITLDRSNAGHAAW